MEHKIVEKEEFTVVGLPVKVSLKDSGYQEKIMHLWQAFISRADEIKYRKDELFYGLCNISKGIEGDDCSFETVAGVEVEKGEAPEGMIVQKVPAAKYFVVTHKGRVEKLGETYFAIEQEMKSLNLKEDRKKIFFELYDERFKEGSEDSEIDIYSPLE